MGGKTSTTSSKVTIPPEVLARYNAVNAKAETAAATPFQRYGETASDFVAQMNEQQNAGIANINATAGSYKPYMDAATSATTAGMGPAYEGIDRYMSPYIKNVADTTGAMMRQSNEQAQSGALGTAISSGAFGGDRAGIAAANANQQQQMGYGKTMADIYNQGYTQSLGASQADLARQMQGGAQMATLGAQSQALGLQGAEAQINAGTLQQQTEQAGKTALINQFMQEKGYPFQAAQYLANIAMGTGALSGTTTGSTQPSSFFSDRRLKEDIKRIGKSDEGLPIYSFKYKGDENHQTHVGFMADEVEKVKPEAVGLHPSGYKTVDYEKATEGGKHQGYASGGVAGPYGGSPDFQNQEVGGYIPQEALQVAQLMVADPALMDQYNNSMASQLEAAANFGKSLSSLKQTFGKDGDLWRSNEQRRAMEAAGESTAPTPHARGGVAGYAAGGATGYSNQEPTGLVPNTSKSYLSDILDSQDETKRKQLETPSEGGVGSQQSTVGKIGEAANTAMAVSKLFGFGFEQGGRVGYATNGSVDGETTGEILARIPQPAMTMAPPRFQGDTRDPLTPVPSAGLGLDTEYGRMLRDPASALPPTGSSVPNRLAAETSVAPAGFKLPATGLVAPAGAFKFSEAAPDGGVAGPQENTVVQPPKDEVALPERGTSDPKDYMIVNGKLTPTDRNAPFDVDRAAAALRWQESGSPSGNYGALGKTVTRKDGSTDRAYGAYQVMGDNIPSWTKEVLGAAMSPEEFLRDPAAQNAVAKAKIGQYYKEFGTMEDVASAWFSGRPLDRARNSVDGTSGKTVPSYVNDVVGKYYSGGEGSAATYGTIDAPDAGGVGSARMGAGSQGSTGLVPPMGGDKAYEDRTTLGKMFYDRDGRVNKDALLSLLSGIGTMASSPSRYLGSAILQGIGGAANTYAGQEASRADISGKNLENMRQLTMDTLRWNELNEGPDLTPQQYAAMMKINLNIPYGATTQDTPSGTYTPTSGNNLKKLSYREFQNGTVNIGDYVVPMQNDPASLQRYIQDNGIFRNDPVMGGDIVAAEVRLQEIKLSGRIYDVNGNEIVDPRTVAALDDQTQNVANREDTAAFRKQMNERLPQIPIEIDTTKKQADVFANLEAGALTGETTALAAMASALGLPVPEGAVADRAQVERALKYSAEREWMRASRLGATEEQLRIVGNVSANPNLQPEAVKAVLTTQLANSLREKKMYEMRDDWAASDAASGRSMDQNAYVEWFNANEPYEKYYEEAKKSMPLFAGELGSLQKPYQLSAQADQNGNFTQADRDFENLPTRVYFITPQGSIKKKPGN